MVQDFNSADRTACNEAARLTDPSPPPAAAAQAESSDEAEASERSCIHTLQRRVTFSDDNMVHHMAGYPSSSSGWEAQAVEGVSAAAAA